MSIRLLFQLLRLCGTTAVITGTISFTATPWWVAIAFGLCFYFVFLFVDMCQAMHAEDKIRNWHEGWQRRSEFDLWLP